MNTSPSFSKTVVVLALSGAFALATLNLGCAATSTRESTGEYVDNAVITAKVKSALMRDDTVKSMAISVQTVMDVVQLSGFVDTAEQKSVAGSVTAAVEGVKRVQNNLIVKSTEN
jgi:hyperosmotically inducible protein